MNRTIDTEQIKNSIDLRGLAGRYTELRRASGDRELCGPCPKCGGDDRFHVAIDWFMCRHCHPKRGDAIEFVQWREGLDFRTAAAMLGNLPPPTATGKRQPERKPQPKQQQSNFLAKAPGIADNAHRALMDSPTGEPGRAYLLGRGLDAGTIQRFKLGYVESAALPGTNKKQHKPAITIPWFKAGRIVAIRYRFLETHIYTDAEGKEHKRKGTSEEGSSFAGVLYGGLGLGENIPSLSTLLICEGELNALSIWQASHSAHVDVLSLGSQSATITPAMAEYAQRYAAVFTWLDKEEYVLDAMGKLPGAHGIKSPTPFGEELDANKLLQSGQLGAFLAMHRFDKAKDDHERERVLWDLWDAANVWPGVDDETSAVIARIAKGLGKHLT